MTDATTDHYENPNFDLRASSTGTVAGVESIEGVVVPGMQKLSKNTISSGFSYAVRSSVPLF